MTEFECVARAICLAAGLEPDRKGNSRNFRWQEFVPEAKAAIEALDVFRKVAAKQREILKAKIADWRARAEPVGPLHFLWGAIADAEAALNGHKTILTVDQLLAIK
jgi:hypothetical protein